MPYKKTRSWALSTTPGRTCIISQNQETLARHEARPMGTISSFRRRKEIFNSMDRHISRTARMRTRTRLSRRTEIWRRRRSTIETIKTWQTRRKELPRLFESKTEAREQGLQVTRNRGSSLVHPKNLGTRPFSRANPRILSEVAL